MSTHQLLFVKYKPQYQFVQVGYRHFILLVCNHRQFSCFSTRIGRRQWEQQAVQRASRRWPWYWWLSWLQLLTMIKWVLNPNQNRLFFFYNPSESWTWFVLDSMIWLTWLSIMADKPMHYAAFTPDTCSQIQVKSTCIHLYRRHLHVSCIGDKIVVTAMCIHLYPDTSCSSRILVAGYMYLV